MGNEAIGTMLGMLRAKKGYPRGKLCRGLCTSQMLIKIEKGTCEVDKFLLDMLLQRLGKSPDKLEMILSEDEYKRVRLIDEIEESIWKGEREKALSLLAEYEAGFVKETNVQKMFKLRTRAYISRRIDRDMKAAETYLLQAVQLTLPGINTENMMNYTIAGNEMENLLALGLCMFEQGEEEQAKKHLFACKQYLDANVTDEEAYAKLFGKCAWLIAKLYAKKGEYTRAYLICEEAFGKLRRCGILYFMLPLLEQLITCGAKMGIDGEKSKWNIYHEILTELYQDYGRPWECKDSLFHNCNRMTCHLDSEFIRQERIAQNLTQEQLIEGVYQSPETLSRVERGKESPVKRKFEGLMENLGVERGKYCGTAIVEDYETLELKWQVENCIGRGDYTAAEAMLQKLKENVNLQWKMNQMMTANYQDAILHGLKKKSAEELLAHEREILLLSYRAGGEGLRVPLRNELMVQNQIGTLLRELGRVEEADALYRQIIGTVENSRMDKHYRYQIYCLPNINLAINTEDERLVSGGIRYELLCGNGTLLPSYLHILAHIERKTEAAKEPVRIMQAYYLCELFFRESYQTLLKDYYQKHFGGNLP